MGKAGWISLGVTYGGGLSLVAAYFDKWLILGVVIGGLARFMVERSAALSTSTRRGE